ncbi:unnamed protein product [Lactuca saligna]|uniref:Uncharacterized protein n=1 Tax=Lactuca saligna TaxID=75948 RepID=A0AA36DZQ8_LACSI|nr:unnamed protein product [Lactuca saligna]
MAENQQGDLYYQALVANRWVEEEPEMVQEENAEARPKEYMVMDYENGESEEESYKGEDMKETPSEPHHSKTPPDQHTVQESATECIRSLKKISSQPQATTLCESRAIRVR